MDRGKTPKRMEKTSGIMLKKRSCILRPCSSSSSSTSSRSPPREEDQILIPASSGSTNYAADLPEEVVSFILTKLVSSSSPTPCSLADYVRFPAVSTLWRRAFQTQKIFKDIKLPAQLPLLILQSDEDHPNTRYFYSLSSSDGGGKLHDFPLRGQLCHQRCRGSSHGWLLTLVPDECHTVRLFNPFKSNNNDIQLPSLFSLLPFLRNVTGWAKQSNHVTCIKKAAFSRNPSSSTSNDDDDDNLIVMVITDNDDLGFCKLGDTHWTPFDSPFRPPGREYTRYRFGSEGGFEDLIYYKGQFHAVIPTGLVACLDLSPNYYPNPKLAVLDVDQPPPQVTFTCDWMQKYLVESSGDLLLVNRGLEHINPMLVSNNVYEIVPGNGHVTRGFEVFKLMDKKWVEIKSLNGWSLFLGDNTSFSLPAHNFPTGCIKPNCIYFTDDYGFHSFLLGVGPLDCGVFNLEGGSFEARSLVETKIILRLFPHWVQLML